MKIWTEAKEECSRDVKYIICYFGAGIVRLIAVLFSNYLLLWITSYIEEGLIDES